MIESPSVVKSGNGYDVQYGSDRSLFVEFSSEDVYQEYKSLKEGYSIYEPEDFITIFTPGNNKSKVVRKVKMVSDSSGPSDPLRFPEKWAAFKSSKTQEESGLPLKMWPPINKQQISELNANNIYTVEQLAALPDAALDITFGLRKYRDMAISWLKEAEGGKEIGRLISERNALKNDVDSLKAQVAELAGKVDKQSNKKE